MGWSHTKMVFGGRAPLGPLLSLLLALPDPWLNFRLLYSAMFSVFVLIL